MPRLNHNCAHERLTGNVVEKWEDIEALEAHLVAPHMLAYRERVKSMVRSATLHILQPA